MLASCSFISFDWTCYYVHMSSLVQRCSLIRQRSLSCVSWYNHGCDRQGGSYLMPIAADILARATHDMADPRKRTTAKLGCSCCAIYLWLRLSHPITVLVITEHTACCHYPYARMQPIGSCLIRYPSIHSGPHNIGPLNRHLSLTGQSVPELS